MKWIQLKKGIDSVYRLEANDDPRLTSKSFGRTSFSQLAFDHAEERMIATDTRGHAYQFEFRGFDDITYKKFEKFFAPTCLAFNPFEWSEILLASTTNDVVICKADSKNSLLASAQLRGHRFPIYHITFYERYCLTASSKEAIIWDLSTCAKMHQLRLESSSGNLIKAAFSSCGHVGILYSNDALQIWSYQSFAEVSRISLRDLGMRSIKDFVFTSDGRAIVICAAKGGIRILDTARFELAASCDAIEGRTIPKRIFLVPYPFYAGAAEILAIHCADGSVKFLQVSAGSLVSAKQGLWQGIRNLSVSAQGRWLAYVDFDGNLSICRVDALLPAKEPSVEKNKAVRACGKAHRADVHLRSIKENMREELGLCRLLPILKEYGEYPTKHRVVIWSTLMELPMNREACAGLTESVSQNASIRDMLRKYPLQDQCKSSLLATMIDRLVKWCPLLGQCEFLPALVFPFLLVFQKNRLLAVEASITILSSFCEKWFEYYPLPPLNVLGIVENVLLESDPELLSCFCARGITSSDYAWPLLRTTLSEVLNGNDWLILWDHILSYRRPSFLLMCVVAYNICCRESVISLLQNSEDVRRFYSTQGNLSIKKLLKVARQLDQKTSQRIHPDRYLRNNLIVLPNEGPYPPFLMHEYPKFLIEEQPGITQLGLLREEEKSLQEYRRKAMKIADEKRVRDEIQNFLKDVHRNRMIELRKCYNEQIRATKFEVENTRDEIERYASTFGEATTRSSSEVVNPSISGAERANSDSRGAPIGRNSRRRSNNCNELRNQVDDLEAQVQQFLGSLHSRSSANSHSIASRGKIAIG